MYQTMVIREATCMIVVKSPLRLSSIPSGSAGKGECMRKNNNVHDSEQDVQNLE